MAEGGDTEALLINLDEQHIQKIESQSKDETPTVGSPVMLIPSP